ncbi:MAG TPA: creatininase family protein, partial [Candidatus Synoicihabitans sp.]|nr:creatininase family protein [Candidatus Synoicihabitans sp.]
MTWLANADFDTAWAHATWTDFAHAPARERQFAVLPVFGYADHGLGAALDAEEVVGSEILHRAVRYTKTTLPLKVLPPLRFGLAPYSSTFFGIDPETAHDLVRELAGSVQAAGFTKLVFFVTSPWQDEFVDAASRDARVDLGLQTFGINLSGLGLDFHPTSASRVQLHALVAHLLGRAPAAASRPEQSSDAHFRPGRWDQPAPVPATNAKIDSEALLEAAGAHLARLLAEIEARAPLGATAQRFPAVLPLAPAPRAPDALAVWPRHRTRYLGALTRDELEALPEKERAFVIIPTGAIEQHGPHLPVGVDSILGQAWLDHALPRLPPELPVWVAPPITFGKSNEHVGFPGTIHVSAKTLRRLLLSLARQLHDLGFRQIGLLNTHGGNSAVLVYTLREIQTTLGLRAGLIGHPFRPELSAQEAEYGFHAGQWETALMLAAATATVRMDRAVAEFPARIEDPGQLRPENAPATYSWISRDISRSGVMGDATRATREEGERWLDQASAALAQRI